MSTARDTLFMASLLWGAASVVIIRIIRLTTNAMARTAGTIKVFIITLTFYVLDELHNTYRQLP
jgi:uncharacterized membrane protein